MSFDAARYLAGLFDDADASGTKAHRSAAERREETSASDLAVPVGGANEVPPPIPCFHVPHMPHVPHPAESEPADCCDAIEVPEVEVTGWSPAPDWRAALSADERQALPPGWEPDAATVGALLSARELLDAELVAIRPALTADDLPPDLRELCEERAAIREHDGGEPRDVADREALAEMRRLAS